MGDKTEVKEQIIHDQNHGAITVSRLSFSVGKIQNLIDTASELFHKNKSDLARKYLAEARQLIRRDISREAISNGALNNLLSRNKCPIIHSLETHDRLEILDFFVGLGVDPTRHTVSNDDPFYDDAFADFLGGSKSKTALKHILTEKPHLAYNFVIILENHLDQNAVTEMLATEMPLLCSNTAFFPIVEKFISNFEGSSYKNNPEALVELLHCDKGTSVVDRLILLHNKLLKYYESIDE